MLLDNSYPCPKCGDYTLIYDGMLAWRSGPRPPHTLARKNIPLSIRADYERERCYHCANCGAEFWQDMDMPKKIHLYEEGVSGQYLYNAVEKQWELKFYDSVSRKWKVKIFNKATDKQETYNFGEHTRFKFFDEDEHTWKVQYFDLAKGKWKTKTLPQDTNPPKSASID